MTKKILSLLILCNFFVAACGSSSHVRKGPITPKSFVTPWEYYQKSRTADWTPEDEAKVQKAAVHSTAGDTKSDSHKAIIIGSIVGVLTIGGVVTGLLLAR